MIVNDINMKFLVVTLSSIYQYVSSLCLFARDLKGAAMMALKLQLYAIIMY